MRFWAQTCLNIIAQNPLFYTQNSKVSDKIMGSLPERDSLGVGTASED